MDYQEQEQFKIFTGFVITKIQMKILFKILWKNA